MAFKILNSTIIDDTRNILNAAAVGIGTTNPTSALYVIGNTLATGISTASRFVSNVAQGTAPISVASSTRVDNLNAQYLNDQPGSYYTTANNLTGTAPGSVISQSSGLTVTGNLSISGSLSVGGTSVILNASTLQVKDRDIVLGITTDANNVDISTDASATHGGVSIASTQGTPIFDMPQQAGINSLPSTYKQWMWISSATAGNFSGVGTDAWVSNYSIGIGTLTIRNGSRLTVGAGFTVFDTYIDASPIDLRIKNIPVVTNINASGVTTSGGVNVTSGNDYKINGTSVLTSTTLGSAVVNSSLTSVGTLGILQVTGVTTSGGVNVTSGNDYKINATSVLTSTTLGSGVVNSSLTSVGTLAQLGVTGIVTAAGGFNASSSSDYKINGTSVLTSTTLGSGVVNSSLTSVGTLTQLNVTGVSTLGNIYSTGIHTAATYYVGTTKVLDTVSSQVSLVGISTIDSTTRATLERELAFAPNDFNSLNVSGISTLQTTTLIGGGTSTGTTNQVLQVTGTNGAYIGGNLGIGSTNPTSKLSVQGDAYVSGVLTATSFYGSGTNLTGLIPNTVVTSNASTPQYIGFLTTSSGISTAILASTTLVYTPSSGNLGVGSATPTSKLSVQGDAYISGITTTANLKVNTSVYDNNGNVGAASSVLTAGTGGQLIWQSVTSTGAISGVNVSQDDTGVRYPLLAAGTNATTTAQYVDTTALAYNTLTNCLGIGSLTPTSKLDIVGDAKVSGIITTANLKVNTSVYDNNGAIGAASSILTAGTGGQLVWSSFSSTGAISGINVSQDDTGIRYPLLAAGTNATTTAQYVDTTALAYNSNTNCLGIGSLTPTSKLDIIGDIKVTGIVTAGDFNSTSDRKLKTNIQPITNPIEKVLQISGVSFNWKESGKPTLGVIAQEIELVLPELVSDTDPKTVNYNGLIGLLIECVKDQQKQIDELKSKS